MSVFKRAKKQKKEYPQSNKDRAKRAQLLGQPDPARGAQEKRGYEKPRLP